MKTFGRAGWKAAILAGTALFLSFPATAQTLNAFKTPPAELAALQQKELDAFGARLLGELYETNARVGSPTGQIGGKADQVDRNAVRNVKALYDDAALIQNARRNFGQTKKTFAPSDVDAFTISDMKLNRAEGDVLVASFNIRMPDRVSLGNNLLMSGETQPQVVVLRWSARKSQWLVFSQADFDTPKAAICGAPPASPAKKARFRRDDVALAIREFDRFQDASLAGAEKGVQAKGFAYVIASGDRKTEDGPVRARIREKTKPLNVEAIRSGNLLAARFDTSARLNLDGEPLDASLKPRLMTMTRGADGQWRLLAIAIFSTTARLAADAKCVKPTVE